MVSTLVFEGQRGELSTQRTGISEPQQASVQESATGCGGLQTTAVPTVLVWVVVDGGEAGNSMGSHSCGTWGLDRERKRSIMSGHA